VIKKIVILGAVLTFVGGVCLNLNTIHDTWIAVYHWMYPPKEITTLKGPINVVGVQTPDRDDGMYFHFNGDDLDAALGWKDWNKKISVIKRQRDRRSGKAMIWREDDPRGRYKDNPKADWQVGDSFLIYPKPTGDF
jgi:hypothetical protein